MATAVDKKRQGCLNLGAPNELMRDSMAKLFSVAALDHTINNGADRLFGTAPALPLRGRTDGTRRPHINER